jgi:hypothetical protein
MSGYSAKSGKNSGGYLMHRYVPALLIPLLLALYPPPSNAQFREYALKVAGQPLKIRTRPNVPNPPAGRKIYIVVTLLDEKGNPAKALKDENIVINVTEPSGKVRVLSEKINRGKVSDTHEYTPPTSGNYLLEAKDEKKILYSDKYQFFVPGRMTSPAPRPNASLFPGFAARQEPGVASFFQDPISGAKIYLAVLSREEGILADGKDAAQVTATFADDEGKAAPVPIRLLFQRGGGDLDSNPFVIPKDAYEGRANWTSTSSASASLEFLNSSPQYTVEGNKKFTVKFIQGVDGLSNAIGPESFSFLQRPTLTVFFVDHLGRSVTTDRKRTVTFAAGNSNVRPDPSSVEVPAGSPSATVTLVPASTGSTTIRIDSGDLRNGTQTYTVTVTNWWLGLTCLLGGMFGGGLSLLHKPPHHSAKRLPMAIVSRLFGSVAGGFVLATLYMFGNVPGLLKVDIARNLVSALAVSLVGGFGGISILQWALTKFKGQAELVS